MIANCRSRAAVIIAVIMMIGLLVKISSILQGEVVLETKDRATGTNYRIREIPAGALFGIALPFSDFLYQCDVVDAKSGNLITSCQFRFSGSQRSTPSSMRIVVHELESSKQGAGSPEKVSIYNQSVDFDFGDGWKARCDFSWDEDARWHKYSGEWRLPLEFRE
jgi:hypothetical protein